MRDSSEDPNDASLEITDDEEENPALRVSGPAEDEADEEDFAARHAKMEEDPEYWEWYFSEGSEVTVGHEDDILHYVCSPNLEYAEKLVERDANEEMKDNIRFLQEEVPSSQCDMEIKE